MSSLPLRLLAAQLLVLSACTVDVGGPDEAPLDLSRIEERSAGLDVDGTCAGACGQKAIAGCWCDDQCEQYGDCCSDYGPVCVDELPPEPTCAGACGGPGTGECWCNAACEEFGDCCPDYQALCVDGDDGDDDDPADPGDDDGPHTGLSDDDLLDALFDDIAGHHVLSYDNAREHMYGIDAEIDVVDGLVECVYTGLLVEPDGTKAPGSITTEHSWPRSDGATGAGEGDLHHLFPADGSVNFRRSNHPFGETACAGDTCPWSDAGSEYGDDEHGIRVFQVRPETQGDIARAHFYFATRYRLPIPDDEEAALRLWHELDPPSARELSRNDLVEAVQENRNPYVDAPSLVARIGDF